MSGALPGGIRWDRIAASGGSLFGPDVRFPYRQSECPDEAGEDLLRLYERASGAAPWSLVKDTVQHEGGSWFEESAAMKLGDFAIAGAYKVYAA